MRARANGEKRRQMNKKIIIIEMLIGLLYILLGIFYLRG